MNKAELVASVSESTGLKKVEAKDLIDTLMYVVYTELTLGSDVTLPGLGKFKVKTRSARVGRNPKTGEPINIPAKRVVKFTPTAEFNKVFNLVDPD